MGARAFFTSAASKTTSGIGIFVSHSEYIVDILAAGPDVYEVSTGRSLGYLDNILDVLAWLDPCYDPPFETIGPPLVDRSRGSRRLWPCCRIGIRSPKRFLRGVRVSGVAVRALIVHAGPTSAEWRAASEEFGQIETISLGEVEAACLAEAR